MFVKVVCDLPTVYRVFWTTTIIIWVRLGLLIDLQTLTCRRSAVWDRRWPRRGWWRLWRLPQQHHWTDTTSGHPDWRLSRMTGTHTHLQRQRECKLMRWTVINNFHWLRVPEKIFHLSHTHTCASVDKETDDHANGNNGPPRPNLSFLHAVKHRNTADMTLRQRSRETENSWNIIILLLIHYCNNNNNNNTVSVQSN